MEVSFEILYFYWISHIVECKLNADFFVFCMVKYAFNWTDSDIT